MVDIVVGNQPIFESSPQMPITRIPGKHSPENIRICSTYNREVTSGSYSEDVYFEFSTTSSMSVPISLFLNHSKYQLATHHVPANTLSLDNYGPPPGLSQGIVELTESDEELENIVLGSKEHTMQENDSAEYAGLSDEPEVWGGYLVQAKKLTDEPICPVHRRICKRAICSTYDDIIRKRDKQLKKEGKEPLNKVGPYNAKQGEKEFRKRQEAELEKKKEEGKNKQRDLARRRNSSKGTDAAPKRQEKTATLPSGQNDPPAPPPAITSMEDDSEDDPFEDDQPTITEVATHPPTSNRLVWSDEVEKEFGSIHTEDSDESDPEPW